MIGEDGSQLGVMSSKDAMKIAEEAGLDLVKGRAYGKAARM